MSGRKQGSGEQSEPLAKRTRMGTRKSQNGSSNNGETSQQQQQPQQQQQLQRSLSPPTVTSLPVVNPASSRPTAITVPSRRPMDSGDQVAPKPPPSQASRRITMAGRHVSEQPIDPIIHHEVSSLPKESFKLTNADFKCPICFEVLKTPFITRCGHTYCYNCITMSIKSYGRCPICNEALNEANDLIANAQLNEVIYKFRKHQEAERRELPTKSKEEVLEILKNFGKSEKESLSASLVHIW